MNKKSPTNGPLSRLVVDTTQFSKTTLNKLDFTTSL